MIIDDAATALSRPLLAELLTPTDRIAVVGNSHSAALALRNIVGMGPAFRRGVESTGVFTHNRDVRLAIWHGTSYKHNATGLKGMAAAFALEEMEMETEMETETNYQLNTKKTKSVFSRYVYVITNINASGVFGILSL
jgi:hypothetical protein